MECIYVHPGHPLQMEGSYGKSSSEALFATDTLFKSPFAATKDPKLLFYYIKCVKK
jgi:hypothetical protein